MGTLLAQRACLPWTIVAELLFEAGGCGAATEADCT